MPPESKVGARVQSEIQKNVILMIILILVSIPLLDGSTWFSALAVYDRSFNDVAFFATHQPALYQTQANLYIASSANFLNPLVYFTLATPNITDTYPDNYSLSSSIASVTSRMRSGDLDIYEGTGFTIAFDIS